MKRWLTTLAILSCLVASGCGGGDQGPADPSTTPTVDDADVQKTIESSMPPDMMKKYGKGAGSSAPTGEPGDTPPSDTETPKE
ncbi:MAG: hypothetical protein QF918_03250 [Pirellulaceae bacterium]|jgi:hypothetical protein|nr:hypothetical protein [Pirellulaceae bacterium]MDP6555749.1 hypothetical protein [Pirellulaceae bacterium]